VSSNNAIVIGAGVIGTAIGLELARDGWDVTILDRGTGPGCGSTAASSAVVRFTYSTFAGTAMAYEGAAWWQNWAKHVDLDPRSPLTRFVQCGMVFFDDPTGLAAASVHMLDAVGVTYEWWDAAELGRRLPHLAMGSWYPPTAVTDPAFGSEPTSRLGGALFTPEAGYVSDPQLAAQNLGEAAIRAGATLRTRAEVVGFERSAGRISGVRLASGELLGCDVVVNAAGPHSAIVNGLAGVLDDMRVTTRPLRQQVAHVRMHADGAIDVDAHPATADLDGGIYFRGDHEAFLVGGVEAECDPLVWLTDPDEVDLDIDPEEWDTHAYRLARRIPALGIPHQRRGVVGVYDVSDDWKPILDRSSVAGYYMAVGTSGNQFKNAPIIGMCMTQLINAVESGHDHDRQPLVVRGRYRDLNIDLGEFSRLRSVNDEQRTRGVLG
jgi:sarcosine oxidase, subunit beta